MKKAKAQNKAVMFAILALLICAGLTSEEAANAFSTMLSAGTAQNAAPEAGTTEIVVTSYPTGYATTEGGAAIQQANQVNVNDPDIGQVFNLDGSNVTNTTWANWTYIAADAYKCGDNCNPAYGNCTVLNVSLIRNNASHTLIQNRTICAGQGFPYNKTNPTDFRLITAYYHHFKTVLTTEPGVAPSSYTVNVTANNGTRIGRNGTLSPGDGFVFLDVWLTLGLPGVPPQWGGNQSTIAYMYNPANVSNFTIGWTDNNYMGQVWLESNFSGSPQNYSMANYTQEYYSYLNVLPAGGFYWKSYGADDEPNWNVSDTWHFSISKSNQNIVDLYLNGAPNQNLGITYGAQSNATATAVAGANLYRNGTHVGTTELATLPAAVYEYKANATGNQNYTANFTGVTYYLTVSPATPSVSVGFVPSNSVQYGTSTTATCTITTGDPA
ncbi:MAG: hypothetical protein QXD77_00700, partial [Candidatus Aenigmatarchaeota archaeon]